MALTPRAKVPLLAPEDRARVRAGAINVPDLNFPEHYATDRSVGLATRGFASPQGVSLRPRVVLVGPGQWGPGLVPDGVTGNTLGSGPGECGFEACSGSVGSGGALYDLARASYYV